MSKKPQGIGAMVLVLTLICTVMAGALAMVNDLTHDKIIEQERIFKLRSIKSVLPEYDNAPLEDALMVSGPAGEVEIDRARMGDKLVGVAFEVVNPEGYSGDIKVLLGLFPDGGISGIEILDHKETPGLGSLIGTATWLGQFSRRNLNDTNWAVEKDGGDIQAITGATISPRSVTAAIKEGLELFEAHKEEILR